MQTRKFLFGLCAIIFLSTSSKLLASGIEFEQLSLKEGLQKAQAEGKLVFIDVYATWCGPCKMLSKSTFKDNDLGEFMNEHFINLKLDGEKSDGESLMIDFDLNAYPTMLFLTPDRELLTKVEGFVDAESLLTEANAAKFPENTRIFKLKERFENGERDEEFLEELIHESLLEGKEFEDILKEYKTLFPELDLKEEAEFIVFCADEDKLDDSNVQEFLKDITTYNELFPDLAEFKMNNIISNIILDALEKKDRSLIEKGLNTLYAPYKRLFKEQSLEKAELQELMLEAFDDFSE